MQYFLGMWTHSRDAFLWPIFQFYHDTEHVYINNAMVNTFIQIHPHLVHYSAIKLNATIIKTTYLYVQQYFQWILGKRSTRRTCNNCVSIETVSILA